MFESATELSAPTCRSMELAERYWSIARQAQAMAQLAADDHARRQFAGWAQTWWRLGNEAAAAPADVASTGDRS